MSDHTEQMMLYTRLVQADPIVQELKQRYSDMIVYSLIEQASPQEPLAHRLPLLPGDSELTRSGWSARKPDN